MSKNKRLPSGRMIRAARALVGMEQSELGDLVEVTRRTIIRLESDEIQPSNPRRTAILEKIRKVFEETKDVRFIYPDKDTGEGVAMRKADKASLNRS